MMIGGLAFALCLTFSFASTQFPVWLTTGSVFVFGFSMIGWNGIFLTLVAEIAGSNRAGMATGISLSIGFLGILLGPPAFGYLVDKTGSYSTAWLLFFFMMALATAFMGFVHEPRGHLSG
jgi:MFS family permease